MPSPSLLKNCELLPSPETFNSSAPTELSVIVEALTVPNTANAPNPKLLLAVEALAKSDKLLDVNKLRLALPVTFPVTFPSMVATSVPVDMVRSPVALGVEVVVPNVNLSADSSHIIAALSPVLPRSIIKPLSLALEPDPRFNPIILSDTSKFVWFTVVVVPLTVKSPDRVILAPCVVPVKVGAAKVLFDKVTVLLNVTSPDAVKSIAPSPASS